MDFLKVKKNQDVFLFFILLIIFKSCNYQDIVDVEYPPQKLYLPIAVDSVFKIDQVNEYFEELPLPGGNYRYIIDTINSKFIIPLAIYRSGVDNKGTVKATIQSVPEVVDDYRDVGTLPPNTIPLEQSYYEMPINVNVPDGKELGEFFLNIDLNYILGNLNKDFGIGVRLSSKDREVNADLGTGVVFIASEIFIPEADFDFEIDKGNSFKINFKNKSSNGVEFIWDFGDGSTSKSKNPSHVFKGYGNHKIKLITIGIGGSKTVSEVEKIIVL